MDKKERLEALINHYAEGNKARFAAKLGITPQGLSTWINRNTYDIEKIYSKCESVNPHWLLTGEGSMIRSEQNNATAIKTDNPTEGIPLIPISVMAGILRGEVNVMEYDCDRYVVPAFQGADFLVRVNGDSMTPTYRSGDIVACQSIPTTGIFFQWNRPYVLDTQQGAIIKRIKPGSDKNHILIVSDNTAYDPFELPVADIYHLALVIGIIRLE